MASHSRSGTTKEQRAHELKSCGFEMLDYGKGSHQKWANPELEKLSKKFNVHLPDSLCKSTMCPCAWIITLPCDPAIGTWKAIINQAKWCEKTVEEIKGGKLGNNPVDNARTEEFKKAKREITNWKKAARRAFESGIDIPNAPKSYSNKLALAV